MIESNNESWDDSLIDYIDNLYKWYKHHDDIDIIQEQRYYKKYHIVEEIRIEDPSRKDNLYADISHELSKVSDRCRRSLILDNIKYYKLMQALYLGHSLVEVQDDGLVKTSLLSNKEQIIKPNKLLKSFGAGELSKIKPEELDLKIIISNDLWVKYDCSEFNRILDTCQNPSRLEGWCRDDYAKHLVGLFNNGYILSVMIYNQDEPIARTLIRLYYDKQWQEVRCLDRMYTIGWDWGNRRMILYQTLIDIIYNKYCDNIMIPKQSKHDGEYYFQTLVKNIKWYTHILRTYVDGQEYTTGHIPYHTINDCHYTYYDDCYTGETHIRDNFYNHYKSNFYILTKIKDDN